MWTGMKKLQTVKSSRTVRKASQMFGRTAGLFTFRSSREGGEAALSDGAYQSLNEAAIASGFVDCVDVELFSGDAVVKAVVAAAHSNHVKVIASNHDFEKHRQQKNSLPDFRKWKHLAQIFQRLPLCHKAARMF